MTAKRIVVDSTPLKTVDETATAALVAGTIARLQPTADIEEEPLRKKAAELRAAAVALKVLPRPPSSKLVLKPGNTGVTELPTNTRAFVLEQAANSSSRRTTALIEYLQQLADKAGV